MADPFRHHPELRGKIDDPAGSFMRKMSIPFLEELGRTHNLPGGWWYSDAEREALRAQTLAGRMGRDLWVFAYGSLMWDPALHFAEIRRARIEGYARKFILLETYGGRGTEDQPGLMAALDAGAGCEGLAFRISAEVLEAETYLLWHREMICAGYHAVFMPAETPQGAVEALAFVADHDAPDVRPDISRDDQVRMIATGQGILGTAADYLRKLVEKLDQLGIEDAETRGLLDEVEHCIELTK
ncbi:Cation transport protein chaC [Candidatus Rhodobacter oscarellae]|uniref:glutathione-specific gamma-glutamylcyclotransferase n=1 Tax=Candidatus Rhodobacter oscarellae TaxID=1675527 RepID=A0A0J9EBT2_9RHOB|nr:gamma-glutamylcyclotransferase [Candidatus Rhodobacter lobularis]KMW60222.1 Cation transport protein chaC [Candidatus Rhodobacter lobularis]